ncbi:MAG: hypothetical protein JWQ11_2934, partial [Rhizobacter sp.]|nr:hypothetical protein [Rhizobacter sp.]
MEALDVSPHMAVEEIEGRARVLLARVSDPYALVF